jgi:uncharacterized protein YbaR (Trm112 family)
MSDNTVFQENDAKRLGISSQLLEMLVCPVDHGLLRAEGNGLACTQCGRTYPVQDGIASMVVDEAPA